MEGAAQECCLDGEAGGRAAEGMGAIASRGAVRGQVRCGREIAVQRNGRRRGASYKGMGHSRRSKRALRPHGADGRDGMRCAVALRGRHFAVVLALAAAACGQTSVGILGEREHRREDGQREGRKQQDGEQASHGTVSVYGLKMAKSRTMRFLSCSDARSRGGVVV